MILGKLKKTVGVAALLFLTGEAASAQSASLALDSLVATALARNPALIAARARVDAARARIGPAGTLPDPMVGAGIMNLPVNVSYDDMTMNALMVGQTVPYPGRLRLQRELATAEAAAEEANLAGVALDIERDVRRAYFDLAFPDRALAVLARSQAVIVGLSQSAESRYAVGTATQQEVLRLQVEAASVAEEAAIFAEQRHAALARLHSLLAITDRQLNPMATIPERIRVAAVSSDPARIRFTSTALGARAADSPLPPLKVLQQRAAAANPNVRAADARIAAQTLRVRLAERGHLPDFDVELQYGQRPSRPDMVSIMVSVPVPVRRAARQHQETAAARAELVALQAERSTRVLELNADVAELHSDLEALRVQLALYVRSILPQGRAAFESAAVGYAAGKTEFATLIEQRTDLFQYELAYERALADFARKLVELERLVGAEVLS